jgi:D-alanyl-D-alanine dipeptidase
MVQDIDPDLKNCISFNYQVPTTEAVNNLLKKDLPVHLSQIPRLRIINQYYRLRIKGALPEMMTRQGVAEALETALACLPEGYEFWVFDAFRTKKTQLHLFLSIYEKIKKQHNQFGHEKIMEMTREFVAHPEEKSRFEIAPHNSGGAIDLTIGYKDSPLDMGTEFDAALEQSSTAWFEGDFESQFEFSEERWFNIRNNRRILFNSMKKAGFTNYHPEWWHYDLGDCLWASTHGLDVFFDSMEKEIAG